MTVERRKKLIVLKTQTKVRKFLCSARPTEAATAKVVRENLPNKSYFANFSDAPDARGHRELPVVKISASNDPWRYQKLKINDKNKSEFFTIPELSFSSFLIDFGEARLVLTSKSSSSRFFALDGQIFRSIRRLGLIFRLFTVRTSTCGGKARVTEIPEGGGPARGQGTGNRDS